ncbi:calcium-binding protein [Falsiroseomonas sp. HC035]|uniref:calcium-binding protein n=1 Tax=Falsiroseomonas sp. HC035 TaxID=3390999 RepID=UPI003D31A7BA
MSSQGPQEIRKETLDGVVGGFREQSGGSGNDTLVGGDGSDKLMGSNNWAPGSDGNWQPVGSGSDNLSGGGGTDELHGGDGDDLLRGGAGHGDKVFGGDGHDVLFWRTGDGNDELHGGPGADTVVVEGASVQQVLNGLQVNGIGYTLVENRIVFNGPTDGQITLNGETVRFFGIEQLTMPDGHSAQPPPPPPPAPTGGDVVTGTAGADNLAGSNTWGAGSDGSWQPQGSGNDSFLAGAGNDQAHGGDGDDTFRMGTGDDKAFGGDGNDTFVWSAGDGNDEFHGGPGHDSVVVEGTPFSSLTSHSIAMYEGGSYRFEGNSIVFNGPSNGQITLNGQVVKFFGMERINFTNA